MASTDLGSSSFYLNRELSQLEFARRVLAMAKSQDVPMLERLRYLCITSSILDEFFEIRVAGLKQQAAYGSVQREADNLSAEEARCCESQSIVLHAALAIVPPT